MRKFVVTFFIVFLIGFDLGTKEFASSGIYQGAIRECHIELQYHCFWKYYPIIGDYFGFQLSHNTGIAFSLPIEGVLLQIITVLILIGLIYYYLRAEYSKDSRLIDIAYILIFAGAISHAYERIYYGYVVDFISVKYFAILNFADIFISIGAILLILSYVREHRKHR